MHKSGVDTIAAVSTPAGRAAISLIRLSGPEAFALTSKIFRNRGNKKFPLSHFAYVGELFDPQDNRLIDKVLLTTFVGPRSFTGEDVVEISCHGNPVIVGQILELLIRIGVRLAEAGEFTRRAFINGKMDLLDVEAIAQLLAAESTTQARLALNQLDGLPSKKVAAFRENLINHLVQLEASLNFPEDAIEAIDEHRLARDLKEIYNDLLGFQENARNGSMIAGGLKIALLGRPNSGKSSLMNQFLGRDRAIVTEIAGTTRDTLEENFSISGLPVKLIDTAGLRKPGDKIEAIGIERTKRAIAEAFAVVGIFDGSQIETENDRLVLKELKNSNKPFVCIRNKIDMPQQLDTEFFAGVKEIPVSALNGDGIANLLQELGLMLRTNGLLDFEEMVLLGARQMNALNNALAAVERACDGIGQIYQDMLAIELEESVRELGRISGETVDMNTLDLIFERFCIGK